MSRGVYYEKTTQELQLCTLLLLLYTTVVTLNFRDVCCDGVPAGQCEREEDLKSLPGTVKDLD